MEGRKSGMCPNKILINYWGTTLLEVLFYSLYRKLGRHCGLDGNHFHNNDDNINDDNVDFYPQTCTVGKFIGKSRI